MKERDDYVTRKDLHNIMRDFKITYSTRKHDDDLTSVALWVAEMNSEEESPVLFYKEQHRVDSSDYKLEETDFNLIIMTRYMKTMILEFGTDKICIDGTHGTNGYDIQLFTLLIIDEFSNGCPVAFMFSNRQDEKVFQILYECVKTACGQITARVFMSDDYNAFYNAWYQVKSFNCL